MTQDYEMFGGWNPTPAAEPNPEDHPGVNEIASEVDEMLRSCCSRVLWEVIMHLIDPDGKLTESILASMIRQCRAAIREAADTQILTDDAELISQIKDRVDLDIEEGASYFLKCISQKLTTPELRDAAVDNLRKQLLNNEPPPSGLCTIPV